MMPQGSLGSVAAHGTFDSGAFAVHHLGDGAMQLTNPGTWL